MHQSGGKGNDKWKGRKPKRSGGTDYRPSRTGPKGPTPQESAEDKAFSDYVKSVTDDQVYDLTEQIDDMAHWQDA